MGEQNKRVIPQTNRLLLNQKGQIQRLSIHNPYRDIWDDL